MKCIFEAIGRFLGAVLVLFVLGFILSFLGCGDSSGPWQPAPDYYVPPDSSGLPDVPLTSPGYDIPPPPDLTPLPPPAAPSVELAPIPAAPIPVDPGPR